MVKHVALALYIYRHTHNWRARVLRRADAHHLVCDEVAHRGRREVDAAEPDGRVLEPVLAGRRALHAHGTRETRSAGTWLREAKHSARPTPLPTPSGWVWEPSIRTFRGQLPWHLFSVVSRVPGSLGCAEPAACRRAHGKWAGRAQCSGSCWRGPAGVPNDGRAPSHARRKRSIRIAISSMATSGSRCLHRSSKLRTVLKMGHLAKHARRGYAWCENTNCSIQ